MAITLKEWIDNEVSLIIDKPVRWLSEYNFHRCEIRPNLVDSTKFFTPTEGVIMDAHASIAADAPFIEAKGTTLTLKELLGDQNLKGNFMVVSIFMTFYNDHHNYIPYPGTRKFKNIPSITTFNKPMLAVEKDLLNLVINPEFQEDYLRNNAREISTFYAPKICQNYYLARIGDYDVNVFLNYKQPNGEKSFHYQQNEMFGKIVYGSQCVLAIPLGNSRYQFTLHDNVKRGNVVKTGMDALVNVELR